MAPKGDRPRSIARELAVAIIVAAATGSASGLVTTYVRVSEHERRIGTLEIERAEDARLLREVREDVSWIRGRMEGKP